MSKDTGDGMTLRDSFAVHASEEDIRFYRFSGKGCSREEARYKYADAMLKVRQS